MDTIPGGGIGVNNAGIILLNSYIPILFERLELIKDAAFKNATLQMEAVHYLQYLATGASQTDEAFLPLNKVLSGLHPTTPIVLGINLSVAHGELINGLIQAAIQHWDVIGATSIDGFRGNWLVRDGILSEFDDHWELTVKKMAYDLLISQAPFSLAVFKYPWMHKPLHIKWPY